MGEAQGQRASASKPIQKKKTQSNDKKFGLNGEHGLWRLHFPHRNLRGMATAQQRRRRENAAGEEEDEEDD